MKILILTTHLNTGGITSYLLSLIKGLRMNNYEIIVVSAGGNCLQSLLDLGAKHIDMGFRTKSEADLRIYLTLGRMKELIINEGIDVIHTHTRVTQVMGHFLSLMTKVPMITTCHGFFKPSFFRRIFPCWGRAVIAISKPVKQHLINDLKVPFDRIHEISNGIDIDQFKPVSVILRDQVRKKWNINAPQVIGIIARLSDVKGIDVLIKAMPFVVRKFPNILLMIVGEGPQEVELREIVNKFGLNSSIRFEKIVNRTSELLPAFDLFVMPSKQEGLGLSVMEAQACALPVVASRVGGLVDLIEEGKTGYLVDVIDEKALALKIINVLEDLFQAKAVGLSARQSIIKNFSLDKMVILTLQVYEQNSRR